jgi:hypothetical protein
LPFLLAASWLERVERGRTARSSTLTRLMSPRVLLARCTTQHHCHVTQSGCYLAAPKMELKAWHYFWPYNTPVVLAMQCQTKPCCLGEEWFRQLASAYWHMLDREDRGWRWSTGAQKSVTEGSFTVHTG